MSNFKKDISAKKEDFDSESNLVYKTKVAGRIKRHPDNSHFDVLSYLYDILILTDEGGKIEEIISLDRNLKKLFEQNLPLNIFSLFDSNFENKILNTKTQKINKSINKFKFESKLIYKKETNYSYTIEFLRYKSKYNIFLLKKNEIIEDTVEAERFKKIIEEMPIILTAIDNNSNIAVWNKAAEKITGYTASEVINKPYKRKLLVQDSNYSNHLDTILKKLGNNFYNFEMDIVDKFSNNKTILWSNISGEHPVIGWKSWAMGVDITERKKAQKYIQEKEQLHAEAEKIGRIGSWKWEFKENKFQFSDGFLSILKLNKNKKESNYEFFLSMIHKDDEKIVKESVLKLWVDGKPIELSIRIKSKDESYINVSFQSQIFLDEQNEPEYIVGMIIDISKMIETEQLLLEKDRAYSSLLLNLKGMAIRCSYQNGKRVEMVSHGIYNLLGMAPEDLIGKTNDDAYCFVLNEDKLYVIESMKSASLSRTHLFIEYRVLTKDNQIKWVAQQSNYQYDLAGKLLYSDGFLTDITERKTAEEKLNELNKQLEEIVKIRTKKLYELINEKDEILNIAAHHLKNPLQAVLLQLNLIKKQIEIKQNEKAFKSVVDVETDIISISEILSSILEAGRLEEDKLKPRIESFNITDLLQSTVSKFNRLAENKKINLFLDIKQNFKISSDKSMISEIFDNLISNAIKFSNYNSKININLYKKNGKLHFLVQDFGQGITKDDFPRMYQKFSKLSAKPTGDELSTGLGLFIVKKLADLLKSQIILKSRVNEGTTFEIIFNNI